MGFASLVGFLVLIISLYVLWRIKQVLLLALAAVILATTINRFVRLLQKRFKLKRGFAVGIAILTLLIIIAGFFALVVPPFTEQFQQLVELAPKGLEQLQNLTNWVENLLPKDVVNEVRGLENLSQNLQSWIERFASNFFSLFSSTLTVFLNSLLVIVVTIMLLANPSPYRKIFILCFPAFYRRRVNEILKKCEISLGGWAIGILFNMFAIACLSGIGLWALGVQLPLANALLAGILTFIPNLGPTFSVIPPTAMALLDTPWKAVAVIILYILIQQIETNILTPVVMQKQVSLLPAISLLSQVAFAVFFGILGLFLALPIVVIAQVWLQEILVKDILDRWRLSPDNRWNPTKRKKVIKPNLSNDYHH